MAQSENPLLQPIRVGALDLSNRVVMAPMTRVRANIDGTPGDGALDYYRQRASAGLIVSEAANISPQAVGAPATPGIWSDQQIEGWSAITSAVHEEGGTIALQLWHTGRLSHNDLQPDGAAPVAPSAIAAEGQAFTATGMKDFPTPRALETDEVEAIVADYGRGAANAKQAGFNAVEIHSANNYLIEQFLRDSTNQRNDRFGGSIENRLRFPLAVAEAVVGAIGADRVGVRISPTTNYSGAAIDSTASDTYGQYVDALSELGIAYLHGIEGSPFIGRTPPVPFDFAALRGRFAGPYITNNCYDLAQAQEAITSGAAELVSFGRAFIANPDLVERFRRGGPFAEAARDYWYGGGRLGYSDWPALATD